MTLEKETAHFLAVTRMPKTKFSAMVGITSTSLNRWLRGEQNLADVYLERIRSIIDEVKKQLQ